MSVISKKGISANTLSKCSSCQDTDEFQLFLTKQSLTTESGTIPKYQTHTFVETNLTATSKGNTVSMVTVSSCIGKKREQKGKTQNYIQFQIWLLMSKVTNTVTFNDNFN